MILKKLKLPSLVILTSILVAWTPLTTLPYLNYSTNSTAHSLSNLATSDVTIETTADVIIESDNVIVTSSNSSSTMSSLVKFNAALYRSFSIKPHQVGLFPGEVKLVVAGGIAGMILTLLEVVMSGLVHSWVVQPHHRLKRFSGRFWDQMLVGVAAIFSGEWTLWLIFLLFNRCSINNSSL